jgi:hypothetical protein
MAMSVSVPTGLAPGTERSAAAPQWLEFLLTGGATLFLLPVGWLARHAFGLDEAELATSFLAFYGAFVINDPHFAVTYLLFYRDVKRRAFGDAFGSWQRVRYWVAGAIAPVLLLGWSAVALVGNSGSMFGFMVQLMFLLVGWHYVKQGFGVLAMLSARRGVHYTRFERVALLFHCYAGWGFAWSNPATPAIDVAEKGVVYTQLPGSPLLEQGLFVVFAASTVLLVGTLILKTIRARRAPPLVPLLGLLVTVWVWVVLSSIDPILVYLIPALHSVQYLYFVWLLERNRARDRADAPAFRSVGSQLLGTALLALGLGWLLFRGAPTFLDETVGRGLDSTGGLGATPYFAVLTTFVNLHHYFMDFVIWRRDNPETSYLMR